MQIDKDRIIGQLFCQTVQLNGRIVELVETVQSQSAKIKTLEEEMAAWQSSAPSSSAPA